MTESEIFHAALALLLTADVIWIVRAMWRGS
jgi:hypothetical protein